MKRYLAIIFCILLALVPAAGAMAAVSLPGNLQTIEAEAFAGDSSLSGVLSLPSSVTQIGDRAFADTNLYGLNMPSGIEQIGSGILSGTGAMFVQIPSATASLAGDALADVTFLIAPEGSVSSAGLEQGVVWMNSDTVFFHDDFAYQYANLEGTEAVLVFPSVAGLSGEFTVPETVGGIPVVEVSPYGFTGLGGLTKVNVSSDVYMPSASERVNWADGLEISVQVEEVDPVLPEDREAIRFYFHEESLTLHPGDEYWLSPNTDGVPDGEWSWYSSDDGIVTFGEDCYVYANGTGTASVTLWIDAGDEGFYYATLTVRVVPADHTFSIVDDEITLPAGEVRIIYWDFASSSDNPHVEFTFESSDESVITLDQDIIHAVAPGTATATVTCIIDGVAVSDAVEVTVVESSLTLSEAMVWAYDLFEYQVNVVTELPEDATVVWSSDNENIHVSQTGVITVSGDEQNYYNGTVTCDVTYADGTTAQASVIVSAITDPVIFDELPEDPITMCVGDEMHSPIRAYIMYFPQDLENFTVAVTSSDESIISVDEERLMTAHKVGTTDITVTVNFLGEEISFTYPITVEPPYMYMDIEHDEIKIWVQDGEAEMGCWYECSTLIDGVTVTSADTGIAKAYVFSDRLRIIPVAQGETTITVTMSAGGATISDSIHVIVYGYTISLSQSNAEMKVGESLQLTPVLPDGLEMDYNERSFSSSDDSIAVVDSNGLVAAMGTGSAIIRFQTRIGDEFAYAQCIVTVTDDDAALTLNHSVLHMAAYETVQMTAYWNGEEISDASWSVSDSGLAITPDGQLYLRHSWPEDFAAYVTCTVERDGETYTATCMVTGLAADVSMDTAKLLVMSVGDEEWIWANFSSTNADETYTVRMTSSDKAVADFPYGDQTVRAVAEGECTVTIELLDSNGSVVATRYCEIMVDVGIPELESVGFGEDTYYITTEEDNRTSAYLDPVVLPVTLWELDDVTITSSDPDIAYVDGHEIRAVSTGTVTVTVSHNLYPEVTATATVHVLAPEATITATEIAAGETVAVTVDGLMEEGLQNIWWEWDDHHFYYTSGGWMDMAFRGRNAGETSITINAEYPGMSFRYEFPVTITGEAKQLNITDLNIEPGFGEYLWPEFEAWDWVWSSTDTSVAEVYEDGFVGAVNYGECDIILTCETPDGNYETSCHVTVADGEWYLQGIDLHPSLILGDEFQLNPIIHNNYYAWPDEVVWSFSDDSMVEHVEDNHYRAVKAGQLVITATATEGEQVETASLTVTITEPAVRMVPSDASLRPGYSGQMELVTASGKEVESVVWSTSNADALTVDDNGLVTMLASEGSYSVNAAVTLTDGTTHTLSSIIHAIPDSDIYFNANWVDYHERSVGEYCDLWLEFDTNAAEEEIVITWTSQDETLAVIDNTGDYANSRATIQALRDGEATVTCNVRIGDFYNETYYYNIHINAPEMWIDLDRNEIHLYVRDNESEIGCGYGHSIPYDVLSVVSSDPSVVKAYLVYDRCYLIPVSEGTATITATIGGSGYSHSDTMTVYVYGSLLSMNVSEVTLNVGETLQLSPVVSDGQSLDYNSRSYESSDASIAYVNGDGLVTALQPGTARIRLQTRVNDEDSVAYCMVTVVDESYPLTLNADTVALYRGESIQLKALWNGEEIDDAAWSVSNNSVTISNSGLVTMHHISSETHIVYAICTVERDGETYTASCMITGKSDGLIFECESAVSLNADDGYWFNPYWSASEDYGELSVVVTSDNEEIARVEDDKRSITACAAGTCTVTVKLVTGEGEVLASKDVTVYVETELPALESLAFGNEAYILDLGDSGQIESHLDLRTEPRLYWETDAYGKFVITSANESVAIIDGEMVRAVGTGSTTISMYHEAAPDMVVTVPVTVYDTHLVISNTEPNVGDLVTVTVEGLEDAELENFYINYDESMLRYVKQEGHTFYFRTRQTGDTMTQVHAFFGPADFWYDTWYTIQGEFLSLNMQDAYYEPGHEFDLWTEFYSVGSWDHVWSSTDESVATVNENGHVVVIGYGECDIVLDCMTDNGAYQTSCHLVSAEGEWELKRIEIEDMLYVGSEYDIGCYFESTYNAGPHDWVWSAEGDALEHIEDNRFRAVQEGIVTIHLTASEGDHVESLSKTVRIVEPAVRPEQIYYTERPGAVINPQFIVADGLTVSDITLSADDKNALSITEDGVTLLATEGMHKLTAKVAMTDGSVHEVFMWISVFPDWEVYWNLSMDGYLEMNPLDSRSFELWLDTNAAEHEISIEWQCSDESIVDIDVIGESYAGSMISMYACTGGEVDITCTVKIGPDGSLTTQTFTCHVYVHELQFEMNASQHLREFGLQDNTQDIYLEPNTNVGWDGFTAVSSDTSVVRAYISSDWLKLTPVNSGEATVTVTMYRAHLTTTIEIPVKISGLALQLSKDEAEIAVGESIILSPILTDGYTIDIPSRNFQSSNQNVVRVDGDGTVCALSAGTAIISFGAQVDITPDDGEDNYVNALGQCVVTVTDAGNPLTLNTTNVQLGWNEYFQLKALWNGEEIDDAVWTSDSNSVSVSSTGMVYMRHHWSGNQTCIITATVTRDDTTYTVNCLVTALLADERFGMEEAFSVNVGEEYWISTTIASSVEGESYTIVMSSSDESIAYFPEDSHSLIALAPGHVTVLAEMKNSAGETVASRTCEVYVETDLPELDSFRLSSDVFYLTLKGTDGGECHVDPIVVPNYISNLRGVTVTAEDPEIVEVDGHIIRGLKAGQTTITATLDEYGNTYTATVYVMDLTLSASSATISSGDTVDVTLNRDGIPTDDVIDIVWEHDNTYLSVVSGKLGLCTYRGRYAGTTTVNVRIELPTVTFWRSVEITIENEGYLLDQSDYQIMPYNAFDLRAEFDYEDGVWSSSDESIATVDQNGTVNTLDYGECDIILTATVNGETVTASCHVTVMDGTWTLKEIWVSKVMYVGSAHWPELNITSTHGAWPEQIIWNTSDESILVYNEEDGHVHALQTGTVTLIATAIEGTNVQTVSETITIVEPAVRLNEVYPGLAPNGSLQIELITATGLTVEEVVWSSGNPDVLEVSEDGLITMIASSQGRFQYIAEVTLSDGSTHTLVGWCECLPQE